MRHDEYLRLARLERMTIRALEGGRSFGLRNTCVSAIRQNRRQLIESLTSAHRLS